MKNSPRLIDTEKNDEKEVGTEYVDPPDRHRRKILRLFMLKSAGGTIVHDWERKTYSN